MEAKTRRYIFLVLLSLLLVVRLTTAQATQVRPAGAVEEIQIPAPSLAKNLLGDPATQKAFVYLPASYRTSNKRYPTIYLLHGYSGRPEEWVTKGYQGMELGSEMDSLISRSASAEMIVVVPNGRNAYQGSFYTNSSVTGNWEDFIYRDLVTHIDGKYRTLNKSASRGIAGHSMGGYGSFMAAMKHPDVFGAVYALSPCCLGFAADITGDNPAWASAAKASSRNIFSAAPESIEAFWVNAMIAISAAFSPAPQKTPFLVDLPFTAKNGLLVRNEPAYSSYRAKMPLYMVEEYSNNLRRLRGIVIDVGEFDEFTHIRSASYMLSTELAEREIPHAFEIYKDGDHGSKIRERFNEKVIPFFTKVLEK